MSSMWSAHQKKVFRFAKILRLSSIQHSDQGQWQGRQLLSPPSTRWSQRSSQSIWIPMNNRTSPYGFGSEQPIVPPSLNDLNLPPKSFNVLATMALIRADEEYSPQSTEPSISSPISTPPMNVSTIEGWETTHRTTDDAIIYTDDESKRVYWDLSSTKTFDSREPRNVSIASSPSSTPSPPRRQKKEAEHGYVFSQKRSGAAHLRRMRLAPTSQKNTLMLRKN